MDKNKQKQLITEIMNDDAKDGLYEKQTAVEWLVQEINKINVSTEARIFINKLEQQAKEMEKERMIEFANWLDKLTPSQRVSVWCKDGSASGLFTMDNEQLFEQFKKVTFKSK